MSYKGNDLDLRGAGVASLREGAGGTGEDAGVLGTWPPHPDLLRDPGRDGVRDMARDGGRDGPIPVDQTVMAVCNAAYDAAAFHGARDVGLQHLLYALTRVEAAREVLEMHGVRTTELRRDAAAAIAEAAPGAGPARPPRSSIEIENMLRRAAGRAGQDSVPASVHDVLRVLLTSGRESPATALLLRSANDAEQLERWAAEPVPALLGLQTGYGATPQPAAVQELVGRLDAMEQRMQALVADVAADRKALLDLVGEIRQEMRAGRAQGDNNQPAAQIAAMSEKLDETNRAVVQLAERFGAIRVFAPGEQADLGGRLGALEGKLADQPSAIANAVSIMLAERQPGADAMPPHTTADAANPLADRLAAVEDLLRGQTERMHEAAKMQERDLGEVFEALVKLGTNQQTLANNLEAWRLDSSGDISIVSNRLERLERAVVPPPAAPRPQQVVVQSSNDQRERTIKRWRVLPATWREDAAALRDSLRRPAKT
jgi:hypothetical protein